MPAGAPCPFSNNGSINLYCPGTGLAVGEAVRPAILVEEGVGLGPTVAVFVAILVEEGVWLGPTVAVLVAVLVEVRVGVGVLSEMITVPPDLEVGISSIPSLIFVTR